MDKIDVNQISLHSEQDLSKEEPYYCKVQKSIGGKWASINEIEMLNRCQAEGNCETWPQIDGYKKICLYSLLTAIQSDSCSVYSFGLEEDWKFEETVAHLGCKVTRFYKH